MSINGTSNSSVTVQPVVADSDVSFETTVAATSKPPATKVEQSTHKQYYRKWLQLERIGLAVVIFIVVGVYLFPVIFFYTADSYFMQESSSMKSSPPCDSAFPYIGNICREELLLQRENCFLDPQPSDILVLKNISISAIGQISPECKEDSMPFLCHYLSGGICDENGTHFLPTKETCFEISNGTCYMAFEQAGLSRPNCSVLPEEELSSCSNASSGIPLSSHPSQNCTSRCRKDFFCDSDNSCKPICGSFSVYSPSCTTAMKVTQIVCGVIGIISAIAVFFITGLRYKKVFVFPSVLVIYGTISVLINILIVFVVFIDKDVFCTSRNYIESTLEPTTFCVIRGILIHYFVIQIHVWWVLHAIVLFASIRFPYHFRKTKKSAKFKYLHIGCVVAGLVLPLICVLISVIHGASGNNSGLLGYVLVDTTTYTCFSPNSNILFYTTILPSLLPVELGIALLIISAWLIHKHHGLFKVKYSQSKNPFTFGTPEKKLMIIFCYYIAYHILTYTYYIIIIQNLTEIKEELQKYFTCEAKGHDPANPCDKSSLEGLYPPVVKILSSILGFLIPLVNLVFVVDIQEVKRRLFIPSSISSNQKQLFSTSIIKT